MTDDKLKDPITQLAMTLSDAIVGGDRELLKVIEQVIIKINLLEARVFELECQLQCGAPTERRSH